MDSPVRSDERRRMARELHDSTLQLLVALQLQLGQLRRDVPEKEALLDEMEQVLLDIHKSIKDIGLRQSGDTVDDDGAEVRVASLFYSLGMSNRPAR